MAEMHIQHQEDHNHIPNNNPNHIPNNPNHNPNPTHYTHYRFPGKVPHHQVHNMDKATPSRFRPNAPKREHCICITVFLLLLGIILLILWLAYHPSKPRFTVASAAVYGLNATTPPLISISMQFNVVIRNPNRRVSIYFDRLSAYVSYRNQPITPHVMLPPLFLDKHSAVSLSPEIGGVPVPVSEEVTNGLVMDESYGVVGVKLVLYGRLRWKAGDINSAHYGLYVKCDVLMGLKKGIMGQVPLLGSPVCDVNT
ncbi:NDR1/HIN1-like protein 12 [Vigna radiata var. radiata]|uniref:NDR1/HIN1-like protein 12 n=1 Tax=Vigna radiata var. radiata TaxID=3916 RepID=A0A1S3W0V9_VIGRR|nr:NDR1/HIN1-like protein 12 [Vigna radiata var. radiata]